MAIRKYAILFLIIFNLNKKISLSFCVKKSKEMQNTFTLKLFIFYFIFHTAIQRGQLLIDVGYCWFPTASHEISTRAVYKFKRKLQLYIHIYIHSLYIIYTSM